MSCQIISCHFHLLPLSAPVQGGLDAHLLVFDINLNQENAMRRMQYLVDGHYIDNQTTSVDVQFITFNGEWRMVAPAQVAPIGRLLVH